MRGYCPRCGAEVDETEYNVELKMCVHCHERLWREQNEKD